MLHALPEWVEQRGGGQRRGGDRDRRGERQDVGGHEDDRRRTPRQQAGDDQVRERAADQPVDLVEPVLHDPDAEADRKCGDRDEAGAGHSRDDRRVGLGQRHSDHEPADAGRGAAHQPLQLLAAFSGRAVVGDHLADHPRETDAARRGRTRRPPAAFAAAEWLGFGSSPDALILSGWSVNARSARPRRRRWQTTARVT